MEFKVGDIIKGTDNNYYDITNINMYAAEVIKVYNDSNQILIKVIEHNDERYIGNKYVVTQKYFELCDIFDTYKNNLGTNSIVKIIEAPYGARGVNETYGILIDSKTADKIFEEKTFCHQGLGENSNYFFIPFHSKFYDTKKYSGEIWGLGKDFTEIEFKDIKTGII